MQGNVKETKPLPKAIVIVTGWLHWPKIRRIEEEIIVSYGMNLESIVSDHGQNWRAFNCRTSFRLFILFLGKSCNFSNNHNNPSIIMETPWIFFLEVVFKFRLIVDSHTKTAKFYNFIRRVKHIQFLEMSIISLQTSFGHYNAIDFGTRGIKKVQKPTKKQTGRKKSTPVQ